jgi:penicillin-binding protein 2
MSRTQPLKDHWQEQRLFLSRVVAAAFVVLVLSGVLVGRLIQLQVIDYKRFSELSQGNRLRIEPLAPTRGLIFDRNGILVAENVPTWQLVAVPEEIEDLDATLGALEQLGLLEPSEHDVLAELIRSHRGFERVKLRNLSEREAARFAVRRHRFAGVDIQEGLVRHYPFGKAAAHAIGYVGSISTPDLERIDRSNYAATSHIGKTGVERSYEAALHGSVGYRQQVVNAQGRVLLDPAAETGEADAPGALGGLETKWPTPGESLVLSLDMRLQLAAEAAMDGQRGAVVALDPHTGDVLALASMPSFDPNLFAAGLSRADFVALNTDPDKPLFNRALAGNYPPGSTLKPFLALAALHYETVDAHRKKMCPGFFTLPGQRHRYRDWKPQGHGPVNLHEAIVQSCDVYFYKLALDLGIGHIDSFLAQFGFGAPTGLDIAGEGKGLVPSPAWKRRQFSRPEDRAWFPGETVITGIGQGFTLVTPLQLAHAGAIVASRGQRFQPRLVIGTEDNVSGETDWLQPTALPPVDDVDPEHWQEISDALAGVTEELHGTARSVMAGSGYSSAGKTGTAQVFSLDQEEEYDEDHVAERLRDHGLYFAYAPAEDPKIALAVVVENGGGSHAAALVARKVLDAFFADQPADDESYVAQQP